ncbi:glycosyltransferase family 2 protein [Enterococcus canintestini]|uniref:Glycosyltransferase 2-like domain-containing protein n=1 Tax=Enterococcus canintestini TaxID=317010 RepID=A0A267HWC3_9ENTE|nr:glycosyltransferase [Enterococcus canintestini]PAB01868.1 hypothetical protein AKL21_02750 [Enterococcus canintestini]
MKPFLSIVCPTYNVENYIIRFCKSILNQTKENFELIFINDGSTDNSRKIIEKLKETDYRVKLINKKNEGTGEARNVGLLEATGEYIIFADPDDSFEENFISEIETYLKEFKPEIALFGYNTIYKNKKKSKSTFNKNLVFYDSKKKFREAFSKIENENNYNSVWNKVYKVEFLKKSGVFFPDNPTAQDAIFNYKLINNISRILLIPKCYYNYFSQRVGSAQNSKKNKYIDEYVLMKQKIVSFNTWENQLKRTLINQALIDFITTQVITYKGKIPRKLQNSKEFIEVKSVLKSIKMNNENTIINNVKIFMIKTNQYRLLYYLYRIVI